MAITVACLWAVRSPVSVKPARWTSHGNYLRPRETYSHVFFRLSGYVADDPAALHAIRHASMACKGHVSNNWMRRRGMSESEKTFHRWQFAYCRGVSDPGWAGQYEMGEYVDLRRRHPSWSIRKGATSYPADLYANILRDAPPPDLRVVQMVLDDDKGRHAPWRFGSDVVAHTKRADRLYRYQRMALRLLECDLIGGCGRNGVLTFELCREEGDCRHGLSTNDIVQARFDPDEVEIIETLHRRMVEERGYFAQSQPPLSRTR